MNNSKKLSLFRLPTINDGNGFNESKNSGEIMVSEIDYINRSQDINVGNRYMVPTTWWTNDPGCGGCCSGTDARYYRYTYNADGGKDREMYLQKIWTCK